MKYGLIIGINYIGSKYALQGCIPDALLMKKLLERYTYHKINILTDHTKIKPIKENIIQSIKNIISQSKDGDELFFSFSGHGSFRKDNNKEERDGKDEMFISLDMKGILDDEFRSLFQTIPKNRKVTVLMDCCHSGTILDLPYSFYHPKQKKYTIENKYSFQCPILLLSGCRDPQYSFETTLKGRRNGYLTFSFFHIMKSKPSLTIRQLLNKIYVILRRHGNRRQKPQVNHSFPINWNQFRINL